jgi:hypothetical protein
MSTGSQDGGAPDATAGPGDVDAAVGPFDDFWEEPILDSAGGDVPASVPGLFGDSDSGSPTGGPCLIDPEIGSLFPMNWPRPRFHFRSASGQNIFEIRLSVENQRHALVVYTRSTTWFVPQKVWQGLVTHSTDLPITVSVRGAILNGNRLDTPPQKGTSGEIRIAPTAPVGSIVYWTSSGGTGLYGFSLGEERVRELLRPAQVPQSKCFGCHSSTPDGLFAGLSVVDREVGGEPAWFDLRTVDGRAADPTFLTTDARALLARRYQQQPVFSPAHWTSGDHIGLTMFEMGSKTEIIWTDLEAKSQAQGTGWGVITRTGDPGSAASAVFSHDGKTIAYASASSVSSGVNLEAEGDIYVVPYDDKAGGNATPIAGASSSEYNEYYPAFSPDDKLLAFNRISSWQRAYNNASAELFVTHVSGGNATRLAANDPPSCSGRTSPGVTNSWPKWAPQITTAKGKDYYWLTFSSTRGDQGNPQLYVTPVVVEETFLYAYPALYLWNQPVDQNNHTPAWDLFQIE